MKGVFTFLLMGTAGYASMAFGQSYSVFAAASLRETVTRISRNFEDLHPNAKVSLNFGGSQQLAAQIRQEAHADVFLSAGFEPLASIKSLTDSLRVFALNRLALVVPASDHANHEFRDLERFTRLVVADKAVPVGHYTHLMLDKAQKGLGSAWRSRVERAIVSREQDVRSVLAKVELGEADAGIVYTTDVLAAKGKVRAIPIPAEFNIEANYPVIAMNGNGMEFVNFLLEDGSQGVLTEAGFASPYRPSRPVIVTISGRVVQIDAAKLRSLPLKSFTLIEGNVIQPYKGFDLRALLRSAKGKTMLVTGADYNHASPEVSVALKNGFFLVPMKDGNLEALIPGQPNNDRVRWVRSISIR